MPCHATPCRACRSEQQIRQFFDRLRLGHAGASDATSAATTSAPGGQPAACSPGPTSIALALAGAVWDLSNAPDTQLPPPQPQPVGRPQAGAGRAAPAAAAAAAAPSAGASAGRPSVACGGDPGRDADPAFGVWFPGLKLSGTATAQPR